MAVQNRQKPAKTCGKAPHPNYRRAYQTTVLFFVCSAIGLAQSLSSDLLGAVRSSGGALKSVHVRLSRDGAAQPIAESVTGADGRFRFTGLKCGKYKLDLTANGWKGAQVSVVLRSDSTLNVSITLQPIKGERISAGKQVVEEDVWFGTQFDKLGIELLPGRAMRGQLATRWAIYSARKCREGCPSATVSASWRARHR